MTAQEKAEESNGSIKDIGGEVRPPREGVVPKVPNEGELCVLV